VGRLCHVLVAAGLEKCHSLLPAPLTNLPLPLPHSGRGHIGGQTCSVVRVWDLADCEAKVQYAGHDRWGRG